MRAFCLILVAAMVTITLCCACPSALASSWYAGPAGSASNAGAAQSPWNLASALTGHYGQVQPGDTIYLLEGTYVVSRGLENSAQPVLLRGTPGQPITIRPATGARVRIDGGLRTSTTSEARTEYVVIRDLEIFATEWLQPVISHQSGSWPTDIPRNWGGVHCYNGQGNKFINLVIHNVAQGMSVWVPELNAEVAGCIIYNCGWIGPDRNHGHCIYTQNQDGVKTYADNILLRQWAGTYSMHAYGEKAKTDNFLMDHNIARDAPFLTGGSQPSQGNRVLGTIVYNNSLKNGYTSTNIQYEVRDNLAVHGYIVFNGIQNLTQSDNRAIDGQVIIYNYGGGATTIPGAPRPTQPSVFLRPNLYEPGRANLVIFNWTGSAPVQVDFQGVLAPGENFRLMDPKDFYGVPKFRGAVNSAGQAVVPAPQEFNVYVVLVEPPDLRADFNGDGVVSGRDFLIWQTNYPTAVGAAKDTGDADGDGDVDGQDFLIWQAGYRPMP